MAERQYLHRGPAPPHGTRARYYARGDRRCRCDACKAANARYIAGTRTTSSQPTQPRLPAEFWRGMVAD